MEIRGTTVIAVRKDGRTAIGADGQVTFGNTVMKHNAKKVRRVYNDKVLCGFAGSTADAFTLMERFEAKLETFGGQLLRAAVELAKDWRTDRYLRRLEAMMVVAGGDAVYIITGNEEGNSIGSSTSQEVTPADEVETTARASAEEPAEK